MYLVASDAKNAGPLPAEKADREAFGWKMLSVELEGWAPLGPRKVTLDLADRRTVLIGRNGAGKSALIEGILLGLDDSESGPRTGPHRFKALFQDHTGRRIFYEHSWAPAVSRGASGPQMPLKGQEAGQEWAERCWYDGQEDQPIWQLKDGQARIGAKEIEVSKNGSVPASAFDGIDPSAMENSDQLQPYLFYLYCLYAKRVYAGIPHAVEPKDGPLARTDKVFFYKDKKKTDTAEQTPVEWEILGKNPARFTGIFSEIFEWKRTDSPTFAEFIALGQKIGAFQEFEIPILGPRDGPSFASIDVDGVNVGAAPDGTLRLMEILHAMLRIQGRSILLLEEPETGIHPGALIKLLSVLEAYAEDRQFVISSHSPVVFGQVKPEELRIVYRQDGQTHVRKLDVSELDRATAFLSQEGTLDEFLLSGAIDES